MASMKRLAESAFEDEEFLLDDDFAVEIPTGNESPISSVTSDGSTEENFEDYLQIESEDVYGDMLDTLWEATCPSHAKRRRILRTPKMDFRLTCLTALVTVLNSCDYKLYRSFATEFLHPDAVMKSTSMEVDYSNLHIPPTPKTIIVRGSSRVVHFWSCAVSHCPDIVLKVNNSTVSTRSCRATNSTLSLAKGCATFRWTQLHSLPSLAVASSVVQEMDRQLSFMPPAIRRQVNMDQLREHIQLCMQPPKITPRQVELNCTITLHVGEDKLIHSIELGSPILNVNAK